MTSHGGSTPGAGAAASRLDSLMPSWDTHDLYQRRVRADAGGAYAALRALDFSDLRLVRWLFALRPLLMRGRAGPALPRGPFVDTAARLGWAILEDGPLAVVAAAVTQPWQPQVTFRGLAAEAFRDFAEPGYVRIAWTFGVRPLEGNRSLLYTETRAAATDSESRARFLRYWGVFGVGIHLIRRVAFAHLARRLRP